MSCTGCCEGGTPCRACCDNVLTRPTPGEGVSVLQMFAVSAASLGQGLTDAVITIFLFESLKVLGAPELVPYMTLAFGGALSVVLAPIAGVIGERSPRFRKYTALTLLLTAAASLFTIAHFMRDIDMGSGPIVSVSAAAAAPGSDAEETANSTYRYVVALAILYRAVTQAAPVVPMTVDVARVVGDTDHFAKRRSLMLSAFYYNYRIGLLIGHGSLSLVPRRALGYLFPIVEGVCPVSMLLCGVTLLATPTAPPQAPAPAPAPARTFVYKDIVEKVKTDLHAVTVDGGVGLRHVYYETFFFNVAFGQITFITAAYFEEAILDTSAGDVVATAYAAYNNLMAVAVGLMHDAINPYWTFDARWGAWGSQLVWPAEMLAGAALTVGLFYTTNANVALVLLGLLGLPRAAHGQFSLLGAGALVKEPRMRGAAFGVRQAATQLGSLVGAFVAGVLKISYGIEEVMLLSAAASVVCAWLAFRVGHFEKLQFAGVAVHGNALVRYVYRGGDKDEQQAVVDADTSSSSYVPEPAITYMFS